MAVDLSAVQMMTIGVGDPDDPVPGAVGLLYIDTVGLAKPAPAAE